MIEYIEFEKKKYPIKIGFTAFQDTLPHIKDEKYKGNLLSAIAMDQSLLKPLLYYSLKKGAECKNTTMPFKLKDMDKVLEECYWEFYGYYTKEITVGSEKMEKAMGMAVGLPGK